MTDICDPAIELCEQYVEGQIPTLDNGGIIVEHVYSYAYIRLLANMLFTMYSSWFMILQFSLFWGDIVDSISDELIGTTLLIQWWIQGVVFVPTVMYTFWGEILNLTQGKLVIWMIVHYLPWSTLLTNVLLMIMAGILLSGSNFEPIISA